MNLSSIFSMHRVAQPRRCWRPVVETLPDRCLLSAGFTRVNLASDIPGLARVTDPNLVNPWGVAFSPTGPFWFANNGSGVSDILDGRGDPFALVVTVPSAARSGSAPTGTVFNGGPGFVISENGLSGPSRFLYATEDGTISGWTAVVNPDRALLLVDNSHAGAVYTGLAVAADDAGDSFLYVANFSAGTIDVFDEELRPVVRPGAFADPDLPEGYAPFNVQGIGNLLFVTYAEQDEDEFGEPEAGAGHGFIDVYDTAGNMVRRFASAGPLNSPWGLALAPADFGPFGGALLVGNNGDGRIHAYDPVNATFLGTLSDDRARPIVIRDLWTVMFGNGHEGGAADTLFFAAGVDYDEHGLFGAVQAPGRQGADTAGSRAFDAAAPGEPGDYPLPPREGPALHSGGQSVPGVELLPLRESSLLLAPTFIAAPAPKDAGTSITIAGSTDTTGPVPSSIVLLAVDGEAQRARADVPTPTSGAHDGLLDFHVIPAVAASSEAPQSGTALDAGAADRAHAVRATEVQSLTPGGAQPQEPAALPAPAASPARSAHQHVMVEVEPESSGGWTSLLKVVAVISMPLLGASWVGYQVWARPWARGTLPRVRQALARFYKPSRGLDSVDLGPRHW